MSPREDVAAQLADTCKFGGLDESYGVSMGKETDNNGKQYWVVTFAKARTLDGVIKVYSPSFILVKWQGMGNGQEVFRSGDSAKSFITEKFVKNLL